MGVTSIQPKFDGPVVEVFDRLHLASALEHEIARAVERKWTHIMLNMTLGDALRLAKTLKGA